MSVTASGRERWACRICGRTHHDEYSPVTWRCAHCRCVVCKDCALTIPGSVPREYYWQTLCSKDCWEAVGRPAD